jgi:hypothetical protein
MSEKPAPVLFQPNPFRQRHIGKRESKQFHPVMQNIEYMTADFVDLAVVCPTCYSLDGVKCWRMEWAATIKGCPPNPVASRHNWLGMEANRWALNGDDANSHAIRKK